MLQNKPENMLNDQTCGLQLSEVTPLMKTLPGDKKKDNLMAILNHFAFQRIGP